jgi:hypothetical protein
VVDGIDTILGKGKFAIKAWHSNSPEIDQDGNENPAGESTGSSMEQES